MKQAKPPSFLSIFPLLARFLFGAGKKLLSVETIIQLEKKQGQGSGSKTPEEAEFDRHLESTPVFVEQSSSPYYRRPESLSEATNKVGNGRFVIDEETLRAVRER